MDSAGIVAARHKGLGLAGYAVFVGDLKCLIIKISAVKGGSVHKRHSAALAAYAHSLFALNARNIGRGSGLDNYRILGSDAERRHSRAPEAYFLLDTEREPCVVFKLASYHLNKSGAASAVVESL